MIGPYCVIDGEVEIGAGIELLVACRRQRPHTIGKQCRIFPFASLGHPPQDLKYQGRDIANSLSAITTSSANM